METVLFAIISVCLGTSFFVIAKLINGTIKQPVKIASTEAVKKAQDKADAILLAGIKELAKDKLETTRIERKFEEELSNLIATIATKLQATNQTTVDRQQEMLAKMKKSMVAYLARSQRLLDNKFTLLFDHVNQQAAQTSAAVKEKVEKQVDAEIAAAQAEIELVKNARLKMLDEKFIGLIEDAIRIILEKKLTVADHVDLIYQSLDKAKKEQVL